MFNGIFSAERIANDFLRDIRDWTTEKKQLEAFIIAGRDLAKIQIEASSNKLLGRAGMACKVLEVNGETISKDEQNLNACRAEVIGACPTTEEQLKIVREALAKFNIRGKVFSVSKVYADGYLRAISIRKRMQEREEGGADVHI